MGWLAMSFLCRYIILDSFPGVEICSILSGLIIDFEKEWRRPGDTKGMESIWCDSSLRDGTHVVMGRQVMGSRTYRRLDVEQLVFFFPFTVQVVKDGSAPMNISNSIVQGESDASPIFMDWVNAWLPWLFGGFLKRYWDDIRDDTLW